jgi:hypothetical protein
MENENESIAPADAPEDQYLWMRKNLATALIILIVVVAAFDIFLLRQVQYSKADMKALRLTVDDYNKTNGPPIDFFIQRTFAYAELHEEFRPVLAKYGYVVVMTNPPAAKPGATPLAPAPAPKK